MSRDTDSQVRDLLNATLWQQPGNARVLHLPLAGHQDPDPEPDQSPATAAAPGAAARPAPQPVPRRERLLLPDDYLPEVIEPPEMGWRRTARAAGARWIRPGPREMRHREWLQAIRIPVSAPRVIAVLSPKGGVGKSTTTALLGGVLAQVRGDLVAALDANPDAGNLAARLREPRSALGGQELIRDAHRVIRYGDLGPYLTVNTSGLCVVRASLLGDARLGPDDYHSLLSVLSRFYSVILVDLGTSIREPAAQAVIGAADAAVAVSGPSFDTLEVVVEGLEWMSRQFPALHRTATAVVNTTAPKAARLDPDQIDEILEDWAAHVVQVPADPHLADGKVAQWSMLAPRTQDAYLELAATVIGALPESGGTGEHGADSNSATRVHHDRPR
ncbi:MAG: MinD/ParA family protein [Streptosporangiaceae bacterium]